MKPTSREAGSSIGSSLLCLLRILYREFFLHHIPMRAAALTFSIILSMVPILALSTSIVKGLGNDQQLKTGISHLIDQWEPIDAPSLPADSKDSGNLIPPEAVLHRATAFIFNYVDQTNFAALGLFGVFALLLATFFVFSAIEDALNTIWHTLNRREWHRKIVDYLALLLFLPLSFNLAFALEALFTSEDIMHRLNQIFPNTMVQLLLFQVAPFLFIVTTLTLLYLFVPQKKVSIWAALAGGAVSSLLWIIIQKIYFVLQLGVANYNIIYGSFASIPLFLIWLYHGWLCILLGALLSYALQHRHDYQFIANEGALQHRLSLATDILLFIYQNYGQRISTTAQSLQNCLPAASLQEIESVLQLLIQGRYITGDGDGEATRFLPSVSAEQLMASEIIFFLLGDEKAPWTTEGEKLTAGWLNTLQESSHIPFSQLLRSATHDTSAAPNHSSGTWQ
ncbi:YihY/virulence factor BrkB family protein [Desulfobulbus rhabdoformis]|uniref:YihY/virulence factor BrkB family protein n=1 Tax=Desulfobulbus rhabdoformis TaxID=34032 RepID=UPI0019654F79|nr:YihY/virulence factor BrkB family protein [Desulfobulbus rhabdoformis]MBM9614308.1 YihY/virulence factor BrkB family protein [Desulfobulbus rhabdoformis]